jgi:hypothetical protein
MDDQQMQMGPSGPGRSPRGTYEQQDLDLLSTLLDEAMGELAGERHRAAPADGHDDLRDRLAAALFRCASEGDRDPESLKRSAITIAIGGGAPPTRSGLG